ncbi:FAD-dependent oxidoreductase [Paenibacillus hemerocallicola]|uniref:FAD-dependent oxidoreductase n=1 Tax=Paenibacillus hemerocallicola TaxID=1172614 RepID=A0A5C4T9R0_9BACL|nr:FAD-dependent oxidoreductase [Paenibacillus hemerocallicola]TNJ65456.1 FAD-dependent oxidoreductase [Paenibacillus hemerocallicola]
MREETVHSDVTVIGGGLAGVCAAVAAARLGSRVALVQNRPVLGGNSSSEVRVWVSGASASGTHRYARETGIIGEMLVENQFRNAEGNPYYWDLVVLETVLAERNIRLFLNTDVHEVEADGTADHRRIRSVTGWMSGSERKLRFESGLFIDCTGDGLVGFLAGAKYRIGREARSEYGEAWAPEQADEITLGSTLLFYTKDAGKAVKYIPPSFAKNIAETPIPLRRIIRTGDSGCHYWWIEWGGELDTVHDNERIRDELWAAIYGIWDYIKNSGGFEAEALTLEWVGAVPGKREYRRLIGDYVLTQNDILGQVPFDDRVAFGGWSIDLHPSQGMYAAESGSKHWHADGNYHIPFRSLYSVNVENMLMAGRNISASHVAFGTTRVMATCAAMGEAAGTAAALCARNDATPRELYGNRLPELLQTLLHRDASVIGLVNRDPRDLARRAVVRASSTLSAIAVEQAGEHVPLDADIGILVPVDPSLGDLELLLDAAKDTTLRVELWETGRRENYVPFRKISEASVEVRRGSLQWAAVPLSWKPVEPQNGFLIVKANASLKLWQAHSPLTGVLCFRKTERPNGNKPVQPVTEWRMKSFVRKPICFRLRGETQAYAPGKSIDGVNRPYGGPHMWISEPMRGGREEWLELEWNEPVSVREIHLTFNDDVNEYLINLHYIVTPFETMPELASDYRVEAFVAGEWAVLHRESGNRKRKRVHVVAPVATTRLRVAIERTNGCPRAELIDIRLYDRETD